MLHPTFLRFRYAFCLALLPILAQAAAPEWRVVLTPSSNTITLPNLPAPGSFSVALPGVVISDSAAANLNFVLNFGNGNYDLWRESAGSLSPYAQVGATGTTGPGRVGAEATHVFRRITNSSTSLVVTDSNGEDARVFTALAGDAATPLDATTVGAWAWTPAGNIEIARLGTDGALGPNIGPGWSFSNDGFPNNNFGRLHALPGSAVLIQSGARTTANGLPYDVLARYQPGVGNSTCSVTQSSNPAWAPNVLGVGDHFEAIRYASSNPRGEVFAAANAARQTPIAVRNGIWQFCAGAPQVKVLSQTTGALGPNIPGNAGAVFTDVLPGIGPTSAPGSFFFSGKNTSTTNPFKGVFHRSADGNRPVLLNGVEGALGPQIPGFVFDTVLEYDPISAGDYAVLQATIRPVTGTSSTFGYWRLRPNASPEPIIIIDNTGPFVPAAGRVWKDVGLINILPNGDVLLFAATSNPPEPLNYTSVWRIRPNRAPEELLKRGDQVRTPTAAGLVLRTVRFVRGPGGSAPPRDYGGDDSFLSASGHVLASVEIEPMEGLVYLSPWVRAQVTNLDVFMQDGFE